MLRLLLVGTGGFLGAALRYLVTAWVHKVMDNPWFPYGTLAVNVAGCLVIGFLAGLAESRSSFSSEARLFVFVGIIGGFTTYSSFAYETYSLARDAQHFSASMNVALQLCLGLAAVWIGDALSRLI
ncbi:MAG TPA: fluoride efflux transporter CrcB [Candidatus Binatia bacterium]|nr:fluoride efflux transporter CrcB [Candidatus Binatia bacterium]